MHNRLLFFAAPLLLCSLLAVAHAGFIYYIGTLLVETLFSLCALTGIPILLYQWLRCPTPIGDDKYHITSLAGSIALEQEIIRLLRGGYLPPAHARATPGQG